MIDFFSITYIKNDSFSSINKNEISENVTN